MNKVGMMMICGWTTLTSQCPLENDHKRQQICQIRHEKCWWSARFFKFVCFTHHSHVTRPESQSNCSISWMCGPPGFHLMFIFPQMEPKMCGPPGFYFLKTRWTSLFFIMSNLLPFMLIFEQTLWRQRSESSTCIPSSHFLFSVCQSLSSRTFLGVREIK